uniref:Uncharacterized protein n=1 Tax=Streptococcus suis TaxID=1307 RepID=A0A6G6AVA4_STRSU|nr:Hypothetical protein YS31-rplL_0072 [Streptococcus suis]
MIMNFTSPFVFLASEKVSSDSLFEGFQVDLYLTKIKNSDMIVL